MTFNEDNIRNQQLWRYLNREEELEHEEEKKMENATWELWTFDTWGNAQDGYEVNDRACQDRAYEMHGTEWKDSEVLEAFGLEGMDGIEIELEGDEDHIVVKRHDGYWIGEMIRNKE